MACGGRDTGGEGGREISQELGWEAERKYTFRKLVDESLRVKQRWDQVLEEAKHPLALF